MLSFYHKIQGLGKIHMFDTKYITYQKYCLKTLHSNLEHPLNCDESVDCPKSVCAFDPNLKSHLKHCKE